MDDTQLRKFCAEDGFYRKPFIKSGWKYATDSRIAIRIPTDESDTVGEFHDLSKLPWPDGPLLKPWPLQHYMDHPTIKVDCVYCEAEDVNGCWACDFTRKLPLLVQHIIDDMYIPAVRDRTIRRLINVRYSIRRNPPSSHDPNCAVFTFEGGQGIVMALKRSEAELAR